ncbi:hypothetical protein L210DRAFT_3544630 [Boletus edulis BED1]|uniref:Uncharacterized protein n=1 Tax=Boletus edulis BED1 TaxID=1328754 RepID=A0AAD4BSR2_BOLED|nr:hypothetical protein L210DRAFT_3544630 [Boletus edulis BED1]
MITFDDIGEPLVVVDIHVWPVTKCPTLGIIPCHRISAKDKDHTGSEDRERESSKLVKHEWTLKLRVRFIHYQRHAT